jgi:hypothetical protein
MKTTHAKVRRRKVKPPAPKFEPPRPMPFGDFVRAQRHWLKVHATSRARPSPPKNPFADDKDTEIPAIAIYRHARGPDLTNDEMGYGESREEVFWYLDGSQCRIAKRVSRQTKTGRQVEDFGGTRKTKRKKGETAP